MARGPARRLPATDLVRLIRWRAAGRPPVPIVVDEAGQVHAVTANLTRLLVSRGPAWERFRAVARRWVDMHCPPP